MTDWPGGAWRIIMTTESLGEAFPKAIERSQELMQGYIEVGPPGAIALEMIKIDIREAIEAMASGDLVRMIRAYKTLEGNA